MLVKLGEVWVDPKQVIYLTASSECVSMSVKEDGYVGALGVFGTKSLEEAKSLRDEYAAIINNSIGQSYGGQYEEEPGAPA